MNRFGKLVNTFNKISDNRGLILVVAVQLCLVCFVFDKIVFQGSHYLFGNQYDGIKNYFTLQGYVSQPPQDDFLKFGLMNYPYGDYIYYTDNTPLFAVFAKLALPPAQAPYFFNLFVLAGILLSSAVLFKLLRRFSVPVALAFVFSVGLPWLSPQMMRLNAHFNLAFSCILLLVVYLLAKRDARPMWKRDTALFVLVVLSGFIHLYYLLISLVFIFSFFAVSAFINIMQRRKWVYEFACGVGICIAALAVFFIILRVTDDYYNLRRTGAEGYDFDDWKLQARAFFTPYRYHPLSQLFSRSLPYESFAYLGTGTLIGIAGVIIFFLTQAKNLKAVFAEIKSAPAFPVLALLFFAALIGVLIALGEHVRVGDTYITNYLSPFYYLRRISPQLTHFRCLGRFSWYFFWMANILTLFIIVTFISRRYFKALLALMLFGLLSDTFFAVRFSTGYYERENLFSEAALDEAAKSFGTINTARYQSILAFPFYHVGSEDYNYTIDPEDNYSIRTMQLSLASGLPLINSKMSRTPLQYTYNIFSLFEETINDSILHDLNDKPILVYLDKTFYDSDTLLTERTFQIDHMPAKEALMHGHEIISKYGMKKLAETEAYAFYEWDLSVNNQQLSHILR